MGFDGPVWTLRDPRWPAFAPAIVACSVLVVVALADGGLFPRTWRLATFALLALACAALLARERVVVTRAAWATTAMLTAFTAWIALSAAWSEHQESALLEAERSLTYVSAVLAGAVLAERVTVPHLLGGVLVAVTAVTAYGLFLHQFTSPPLDPFQGRLLQQPIGYANALGIFVAIGVLLSLGLAHATRRGSVRVAAILPLPVLGVALALTSSRGAWLALAVGITIYVALVARPRLAVAVLAAAVAAAATGLIWGRFVSAIATDNRVDYWRVAWRQYEDNPVMGAGAGTFVDYWFRYRTIPSFTRTSHNLYLESLAELGPVGLGLVALALALPLVALVRRRDRYVAAAAAAYVAFVVHLALDWDWELPAPTLAGLFCGVALLVSAGSDAATAVSHRTRLALLVPALGLMLLAALRFETGGNIPFGR